MRRWLFLGAVAVCMVVLDQLTKALVVSHLALYESWVPIEALSHLFAITYITNTGAVFGILPDGGFIFSIITLFVVVGLIYYYRNLRAEGDRLTRLALGLMLGGALGNLIDRVRLGHVTDFIHFSFWPVFNIADSCIVIGVGLLTLITFWDDYKKRRKTSLDDASAL
ncbi:MAG: signal peptidase II [Anaerolineae bacterium]|nr:signal peptidase II [Anaerolineae bacterium]